MMKTGLEGTGLVNNAGKKSRFSRLVQILTENGVRCV